MSFSSCFMQPVKQCIGVSYSWATTNRACLSCNMAAYPLAVICSATLDYCCFEHSGSVGWPAHIPLDQALLFIDQIAQLQDLARARQDNIEANSSLKERHHAAY